MTTEQGNRQRAAQIEDLVHRIEGISDPAVKANATVLIQSLLDLHREGFERVTQMLRDEGETGNRLLQRLAADELTGSLLLLYELHPDDFEVRLGKGIAEAEKAIAGQGATVNLTGVRDGVVHLRLTGKAHGCGSTQGGMEKAIRDAIFSAVPEVVAVRVENAVQSGPSEQLVQLQLAVAEPQRT